MGPFSFNLSAADRTFLGLAMATFAKSRYSEMHWSQKIWPQFVICGQIMLFKHIGQEKSWGSTDFARLFMPMFFRS